MMLDVNLHVEQGLRGLRFRVYVQGLLKQSQAQGLHSRPNLTNN